MIREQQRYLSDAKEIQVWEQIIFRKLANENDREEKYFHYTMSAKLDVYKEKLILCPVVPTQKISSGSTGF